MRHIDAILHVVTLVVRLLIRTTGITHPQSSRELGLDQTERLRAILGIKVVLRHGNPVNSV